MLSQSELNQIGDVLQEVLSLGQLPEGARERVGEVYNLVHGRFLAQPDGESLACDTSGEVFFVSFAAIKEAKRLAYDRSTIVAAKYLRDYFFRNGYHKAPLAHAITVLRRQRVFPLHG